MFKKPTAGPAIRWTLPLLPCGSRTGNCRLFYRRQRGFHGRVSRILEFLFYHGAAAVDTVFTGVFKGYHSAHFSEMIGHGLAAILIIFVPSRK